VFRQGTSVIQVTATDQDTINEAVTYKIVGCKYRQYQDRHILFLILSVCGRFVYLRGFFDARESEREAPARATAKRAKIFCFSPTLTPLRFGSFISRSLGKYCAKLAIPSLRVRTTFDQNRSLITYSCVRDS